MASYIGKVDLGSGDQYLIGSTLYGICSTAPTTAAKVVALADFDSLINGVTVHIRFIDGNTATTGLTLEVGSTLAYPIHGNCVCGTDAIMSFTFAQDGTSSYWYVNSEFKVEEGSTDGTIKINGVEYPIHGLGSAAYANTSDFATAAQGQKADDAMPKSGGTFTGPVILDAEPTQALGAATKSYVDAKTAGLSGLTGAMHFRGETPDSDSEGKPTLPSAADSFENYAAGDVILVGDQEWVYNKGANAASSEWLLLGDEGSYALKTSTASVGSTSGWDAGSTPTLGDAIDADDITNWDAGSSSGAEVTGGVLKLTNSTVPTLNFTAKTIPNVTNVGTAPSLIVTPTTVVVP